MQEMRVRIETKEPVNGEIRSAWFTLPTDEEEVSEILGIDAYEETYRILETEAPFAEEIKEDMTVGQLRDYYDYFEELPSDMQEDYHELMCYYSSLEELHQQKYDIIHYPDCRNMSDIARYRLSEDPAFNALTEKAKEYFDFEGYGEYLDDNGTFVETDHGIYELP